MANYSFEAFSSVDFEELVRDLLQAELSIRFESFTSGPDGGVDLRHSAGTGAEQIVQCKQFASSGYSKLLSHLKATEIPKIQKLKPRRYLLVTSVPMTPHRKKELLAILAPYCRAASDIYGKEDLNNLLGRHEEVERRHHKLWLSSESVLRRVLQNRSFVQSELEREMMLRRVSLYVQTPAYDEALGILNQHHYCVISGIPGIGKTMLANMLALTYIETGYDLIVARSSVDEALDRYSAQDPQIIYYDDFLGRTSLGDRLGKNEDQSLHRLISATHRARNKRLILTTREYILAQGREQYELLNRAEIDVAKCILALDGYTNDARARILYNHVYFSGMASGYVESILSERSYRRIIEHRNYNPRIVEWMTSSAAALAVPPEHYAAAFVASLDDPSEVWRHVFESQIGSGARYLLLLLATIPDMAALEDLELLWLTNFDQQGRAPGDAKLEYLRALREVEGSLTSAESRGVHTGIEFHNPSIRDFMHRELARNQSICEDLLASAMFFEQIERLVRIGSQGIVQQKQMNAIGQSTELCDAIVRTLDEHSPCIQRVRMSDGTQWLSRRSRSLGRRLSTLARWATELRRTDIMDLVCRSGRRFLDNDELSASGPEELCGFIEQVVVRDWGSEQRPECLIADLVNHCDDYLGDIPSVDDWIAWALFLKKHSSKVDAGSEADLMERAKSFAAIEIDHLVQSTDYEAVDWGLGQLQELQDAWSIDLSVLLGPLYDVAEELERAEDDAYAWRDDELTSQVDMTPAVDIDDMFDSLRDIGQ